MKAPLNNYECKILCNKKVNEKVLESFKILYLIQTWNLIKYSFIWIQKFLIFNVSHATLTHTHIW